MLFHRTVLLILQYLLHARTYIQVVLTFVCTAAAVLIRGAGVQIAQSYITAAAALQLFVLAQYNNIVGHKISDFICRESLADADIRRAEEYNIATRNLILQLCPGLLPTNDGAQQQQVVVGEKNQQLKNFSL